VIPSELVLIAAEVLTLLLIPPLFVARLADRWLKGATVLWLL